MAIFGINIKLQIINWHKEKKMNLENYTNINIFKKVYENREVMSSNNMIEQPHHARKATEGANAEHASGFNPYVNNQGTTVGKFKMILVNQLSMNSYRG